MNKTRKRRAAKRSSPISARHRALCAAIFICAVTVAAAGIGWYTAPMPPAVSFVETDPAIVGVIEDARWNVLWSPRSAAAWGRLGQVLRAHNYLSEAHLCLAHAERFDSKDPRWPYLQGVDVLASDHEAAIRHLQRAVALCGCVPDAPELCLAELCLQQGRLDDAEHHFQHVLQHAPDNPRAHLGLGRLASERGNLKDGIAHLSRSAARKLTQKASVVLLAQTYHQLGDLAAASRERTRAAGFPNDPPWPDPFIEEVEALRVGKHFRLARLESLHKRGRRAEARPVAAGLEEDYPDIYWLVEGRHQMKDGQWAAAERALRTAARLDPDSVDAHFDLGMVLLKQKNALAAVDCFQRVIQIEPTYGPAYQRLADCWKTQGRRPEAIQVLQTAASYMPLNAEIHRELGGLLLEDGRLAEAIRHLQQALQLQPEDARAKELLEQASRRAG